MTVPCRCLTRVNGVKCTQRKSLAKHPRDYKRQPECPQCHQRHWYVETYRLKKEMGYRPACECGGYHFRHRRGSKFCYYHPNAEEHHSERYEEAVR